MAAWWRVALGPRPASEPERLRFVAAAGRDLGLGAGEAGELWARLPRELLVTGLDELHRRRLVDAFAAAGVRASCDPSDGAAEPCPRHPRLAARDVCPRCERGRACPACLELSRARACDSCARKAERRRRARRWRVAVLLIVLGAVAFDAWRDRRRVVTWRAPLIVGIHPINADGSAEVDGYIATLEPSAFAGVGAFLAREAERRGVRTRPLLEVALGPQVRETPPPPPDDPGALAVAAWSLKLRAWVWHVTRRFHLPPAQVRMFVLYHAPRRGITLEHSLGLEKGHVGVAHLFSGRDEAAANEVVIAHELLHTAGATDKYDAAGQPVYPDGYADPAQSPRFPQRRAEIMGGRIPVSDRDSKMAEALDACVVGDRTAAEIGWVR